MTLSLKQARRMVAKSRRRVWRLARRYGYPTRVPTGWDRTGYASWLAEDVMQPRTSGAWRLADELHRRWDKLRQLEVARGEVAWRRPWKWKELPALDHGQDHDELLQDVADYYADARFCSACGSRQEWERCYQCGGEGLDGHDCGEDVCCCLEPEENELCDVCRGEGGWWQCPNAP